MNGRILNFALFAVLMVDHYLFTILKQVQRLVI